jgi:hypothetical protein
MPDGPGWWRPLLHGSFASKENQSRPPTLERH